MAAAQPDCHNQLQPAFTIDSQGSRASVYHECMNIGILVFPGMNQLDATGPLEVFSSVPGAKVLLIAKGKRPVEVNGMLRFLPHADLRGCPKLDALCVPGGSGVNALLLDDDVLGFVRRRARTARFVTSVCTGSLVLGAAGLLRGRRAACHWASLPLLSAFGARPSARRIVKDGKFITAGGVTSGIDFGLFLVSKLKGVAAAKEIQLYIQYDPQPPFRAGTPAQAGKRLTAGIVAKRKAFQADRAAIVARAAARLRG
jgi:cyclohexyl-isocyanide hydratase